MAGADRTFVPTGFRFDPVEGVIDIGGHNLAGTKKFRDARTNPQVAFVVDDLASTEPWRPRAVEVRGRAQTFTEGGERLGPGFGPAWIRIIPTRVVSWGLDTGSEEPSNNRPAPERPSNEEERRTYGEHSDQP